MGDTGPCGPCSEIHFDRIGGRDAAAMVNADDPTVIEIWNIVFMQFNREPSGALRELPAKHIDTGMGFERLTSILQNKMSNYDTDIFAPLFAAIQERTGAPAYAGKLGVEDTEGVDMAYRVIADHARTLTFAITDGAVPSNEGRGYVLRRILRRAVRYGQQFLKARTGFFSSLVPVVVANFKSAFPELQDKEAFVMEVIRDEEESFGRTLSNGIKTFNKTAAALKASGGKVVAGADAFFLYDSMGFPLDLTQIMAGEAGLSVDVEGFYKCMAEQKARSQAAQKFARDAGGLVLEAEQTAWLSKAGIAVTDDAPKYTWYHTPVATVKAIYTKGGFLSGEGAAATPETGVVGVVLDTSSFYAESGGQVSDIGALTVLAPGAAAPSDDGAVAAVMDVNDVQVYGGYVLHIGGLRAGEGATGVLRVGDKVACGVDYEARGHVAPNHTMTHVLNFALREVLGSGVEQRGSIVMADKARFDFSCSKAPTPDQLAAVEKIVRDQIAKALPVHTQVVSLAQAKAVHGLRAVFGEVYPDPVRVVAVGAEVATMVADPENAAWMGLSVELCGGTHIPNTSRAGDFALVEEGSIAKGVRRIVGVTREAATAAHDKAAELEGDFATARALTGAALEARIESLKNALNEAVIPAHVKSKLRDAHAELVKQMLVEQKAEAGKLVEVGKAVALPAAAAAAAAGKKHVIVADVPIKADGKALVAVAKAVSDAHPDLAFFALSSDGKEKLLAFAATPKAAVAAGANAKDWIAAVMEAVGGKGGGREDTAQGTTKDIGKAGEAAEAAAAWIAGKY